MNYLAMNSPAPTRNDSARAEFAYNYADIPVPRQLLFCILDAGIYQVIRMILLCRRRSTGIEGTNEAMKRATPP